MDERIQQKAINNMFQCKNKKLYNYTIDTWTLSLKNVFTNRIYCIFSPITLSHCNCDTQFR